ncbi:monocarboxylate transporter 12 [Elysia marginata]|uniref:Monocarboxylate transporter 12 n=1 Tax=Elysia marginata TaxID=1093978 RepID=A0AAV4F9V6_9GAST|nr:monocarboxylate transporter 12 [Elysia marginata]
MWLSVAADVRSSVSSVWSDDHQSTGKDLRRTTSKSRDVSPAGCDVINTDSDSGAVDDSDLTNSGDFSETPDLCPDGGYGWVVVVASCFNAFIIDGVGSCYGLIYPHVMEKYGASASVASFAGSLFNALLIMGSVSVMLVRKFGYRKVTMCGGLLACLSFVLSTQSPNVVCFVLSYGLFTGCACGLVFLPSIVIVNSYFHEKRGLANGIITSGSGAGLLVLAQLVNYLLQEFSLDGALLVLAGVLLNTCVFSCVYRPPHQQTRAPVKEVGKENDMSLTPRSGSTDSGLLLSPSLSPSLETVASVDLCGSDTEVNVRRTSACEQNFTGEGESESPATEKNHDADKNTTCSELNQRRCLNGMQDARVEECNENIEIYQIVQTDHDKDDLAGQEVALLPHLWAEENTEYDYFGLESLASVFGLLTTIKGASSMLGPPLAGLVYDASGHYPMSFVFGGVVFLLAAAVHVAMPFCRPRSTHIKHGVLQTQINSH